MLRGFGIRGRDLWGGHHGWSRRGLCRGGISRRVADHRDGQTAGLGRIAAALVGPEGCLDGAVHTDRVLTKGQDTASVIARNCSEPGSVTARIDLP